MGQHERCRKHRRNCHKSTRVCKDKCKPITKYDFGCHRDETYYICKPGYYCLKDDVSFKPQPVKSNAIVIDSDYVVLDLCGHELSQGNDVTFCRGILVKAGHENVTILGSYGSIKNFTLQGIYVEGDNKDVTIGDDTQLDINGCGKGSNFCDAAVDPATNVLEPAHLGALQFGETKWWEFQGYGPVYGDIVSLLVKNVKAERNMGRSIVLLGNGKSVAYENVSVSFNSENRSGSGFTVQGTQVIHFPSEWKGMTFPPEEGISDDLIDGWTVDNCDFSFNAGSSETDIVRLDAFNAGNSLKNVKVTNSRFNSNTAVSTADPEPLARVRACVIFGVDCVDVVDSEACDNVAGFMEGFHISGFLTTPDPFPNTLRECRSVDFVNCKAANNIAKSARSGTLSRGFIMAYTDGYSYTNCIAENNSVSVEEDKILGATTNAYGIRIVGTDSTTFFEGDTLNGVVKGCRITQNTVNTEFGTGYGIDVSDDIRGLSILDCDISENSLGYSIETESFPNSRNGYGIRLVGTSGTPSISRNQYEILQGNRITLHATAGIYVSGSSSNVISGNTINGIKKEDGTSVGILLDNDAACNTVRENLIVNSDNGIKDSSSDPADTLNLIAENKVFNVSGTAYKFTPVFDSSGSLTSFPAATGDLCINVDISK